jgi:hypothetical protein
MCLGEGTRMKAFVSVVVLIAACGGGNNQGDDAPDDGGAGDASFDAPPPMEVDCPNIGTAPVCGSTTAPTAPATSNATCNPLTQTGCAANEKCAWIEDQDNPPIGHVGCVPDGTVPLGCDCTQGAAGTTGYDDCIEGTSCIAGTCRQICDVNGGAPACPTRTACQRYADVFEVGGTAVAGVCDPTCDPLTQCTHEAPAADACSSANTSAPTRGCYGYDEFSCAPAAASTLALTDRQPPRTNSAGNPFLNGCAPGFIPLFFAMTGSTMTLCTGMCAALEVDNTPAHANNGLGDPSAAAKLPTQAKARIGNATCEIGKKGSEASSRCLFMWPYVEDDATGDIPPSFMPYVDTLGVCMSIDRFMYDSNNDQVPDMPRPDCKDLPPRSASTPADFDDAADWGCQKRANSARVAPALRDVWIPRGEPMPIVRHAFD